jgi:hypothetical protein
MQGGHWQGNVKKSDHNPNVPTVTTKFLQVSAGSCRFHKFRQVQASSGKFLQSSGKFRQVTQVPASSCKFCKFHKFRQVPTRLGFFLKEG